MLFIQFDTLAFKLEEGYSQTVATVIAAESIDPDVLNTIVQHTFKIFFSQKNKLLLT